MKAETTLIVALLVSGTGIVSAAPLGAAFTFQGKLTDAGNPANGNYDLTFTLCDNASGGTIVAGPLTNSPVGVTNGLFAVTLDFGVGVFDGNARWLEIGVRTNGGAEFSSLSPRQLLAPAPYALYAPSAGSVAAANIIGTVALAQLPGSVVTNGASGVTLSGTFAGGDVFGYPIISNYVSLTNVVMGTCVSNATDLLNAATNAPPNTIITIAPGTYSIGTACLDLPNGVSLVGFGTNLTIIEGDGAAGGLNVGICPGDNSCLMDFTLRQRDATRMEFWFPVASSTKTVTNVLVKNLLIDGATDCIYMTQSNCTIWVENCTLRSCWDVLYFNLGGYASVRDCRVEVEPKAGNYGASLAQLIVLNGVSAHIKNVRGYIKNAGESRLVGVQGPEMSNNCQTNGWATFENVQLDFTMDATQDWENGGYAPLLVWPDYTGTTDLPPGGFGTVPWVGTNDNGLWNNLGFVVSGVASFAQYNAYYTNNYSFINCALGFSNRWWVYNRPATPAGIRDRERWK